MVSLILQHQFYRATQC